MCVNVMYVTFVIDLTHTYLSLSSPGPVVAEGCCEFRVENLFWVEKLELEKLELELLSSPPPLPQSLPPPLGKLEDWT